MARAAVLGGLSWQVATVAAIRPETPAARTLVLDVPGWPGHVPGQHVDVRLTAPDGYTASRSYSVASVPSPDRFELTVQWVPEGEVSSYLIDIAKPGDQCEVRGPIGGYFAWRPEDPGPVLLVAGGSGIVPLMSMVRARAAAGSTAMFRLVYGTRSPDTAIYAAELAECVRDDDGLEVAYAYSRVVPPGWPRPPSRVDIELLTAGGWPPEREPTCYVCGPTGFVETVATLLVDQGHAAQRIRTERFGPTGG